MSGPSGISTGTPPGLARDRRPDVNVWIRNATVVTPSPARGAAARRGPEMSELLVLERHDVLCAGARIMAVRPSGEALPAAGREDTPVWVLEAGGRVVLPGLVDCHTHACFAGTRHEEWTQRLAGVSYLDILRRGGGIMSTVRAVRAADELTLARGLWERVERALHLGTTTIEVKSGYGLTVADEMKMLDAIARVAHEDALGGTVVATALLGHALDPDRPGLIEEMIGPGLDAVHGRYPGVAVDVYCEEGAWPLDAARRLLGRARELGHPVRIHADQFHALGAVPAAVALGAASVDHLEATEAAALRELARYPTIGVALPVSGFHLAARGAAGVYADLRTLIDAGGAAAVASNGNPGSAPTPSLPLALGLAVRHCGLTPAEAIVGGTVNAAAVLGLRDRGVIAPGWRADLVMLVHQDYREMVHEIGGDPVAAVVAGGAVMRGSAEPVRGGTATLRGRKDAGTTPASRPGGH